jgi:putative transcriptional regulator
MRAIRKQLKMSQQQFANAYYIPLSTLKGWEQGHRQPDAIASAFLSVIARLPDQIQKALQG